MTSNCPRHPNGDGPSWCQDCHGVRLPGFDAAEGTVRRERSIKQVEEHADDLVKADLLRIGRLVASIRENFTTDAIRYLYEKGGYDPIREPRVLGPIMRQLEREGIVQPLDRWKLSEWASNHRRPIRVWKSTVYRRPDA